jgi:beta-lactam-binding protein with PASTA domain
VQWFRLTGDRTEQLVTVPDVAGLPELRARTELGGVGLVASDAVVTEPAGNERPGTVVRTDPAAGRQVALGTLVTLVVRGRRL